MTVKRESCEYCGSEDNKTTFDNNGSVFCFTPDCAFNKEKKNIVNDTPKELIQGECRTISNRRLSQRTCEFFSYQIGKDESGQDCHIANYRDSTGKIIAQKIRYADKRFRWTGEANKASLYGKHLWSNNSNNIIITEGEIDCLSVAESQDCKWPVVSLPNGAQSAAKTLKAELEWLGGFKQIILCFDMDEAGQAAVEACVGLFPPGKIRIANLSGKDANEVLLAGKTIELTKLVWNAAEYRPDGITWGGEIDLKTLIRTPKVRGLQIKYPILNEMLRGFLKHRIYSVYAGTGIGKSTFLKELVYDLKLKNPELKVANIFLEEDQAFTVQAYVALHNNIRVFQLDENPNFLTDEQIEDTKNKILKPGEEESFAFYDHFGSLDSKRLFNLLEYLAIGKGVEVIVLDHISILISGLQSSSEGERRDLDNLMTGLRSFTQRTGVILVLATQLKRKDGESYGEGADVKESDARGSGAIEQISDFIISISRNKKGNNPNLVQIDVLKNRYTGDEGHADELFYDKQTGRLETIKLRQINTSANKKILNKDNLEDMI